MQTRLQGVLTAGFFAVLSLALGGASCDKKSVVTPTSEGGPSVPFEAPPAQGTAKPAAPPQKPEPVPAPPAQDKLNALLEKLPSPCGKAMSLKKTLESDPSCKQGPFAKKYVERLMGVGLVDEEIPKVYGERYSAHTPATFVLEGSPFIGTPNAPVVLVEFFDYACPHCKEAAPVLAKMATDRSKDVVLYYKNFPLHKSSMDTAKAALAAHQQGKFEAMHEALFAHQGNQSREEIFGYAKELGLDMAKFEKDFGDPAIEAKIKADKDEGLKADLKGTPTIYINGRPFSDFMLKEGLSEWIDEELAVNR